MTTGEMESSGVQINWGVGTSEISKIAESKVAHGYVKSSWQLLTEHKNMQKGFTSDVWGDSRILERPGRNLPGAGTPDIYVGLWYLSLSDGIYLVVHLVLAWCTWYLFGAPEKSDQHHDLPGWAAVLGDRLQRRRDTWSLEGEPGMWEGRWHFSASWTQIFSRYYLHFSASWTQISRKDCQGIVSFFFFFKKIALFSLLNKQ